MLRGWSAGHLIPIVDHNYCVFFLIFMDDHDDILINFSRELVYQRICVEEHLEMVLLYYYFLLSEDNGMVNY